MSETADGSVQSRSFNEIQRGECMRLSRARRDGETVEQRAPYQVRRPTLGGADAQVDARLPKVVRQELSMAVGEVQQMHVAEGRYVVEAVGVTRGDRIP